MRAGYALSLVIFLVSWVSADQNGYFFKTSFMGRDFLQHWTWYSDDDPTHGRVNYVDQATALQRNLSYGEHSWRFTVNVLIT